MAGKNKEIFQKSFFNMLGIGAALIALLILLFAGLSLVKFIKPGFSNFLSTSYIVTTPSLENIDKRTITSLNYLIAKGKIVSAEDLYSNILSYYDTLVTFLIGILGIFALVSWFSLEGRTKHVAESCVDYKIDHGDFEYKLNALIKTSAQKTISDQREEFKEELMEEIIGEVIEDIIREEGPLEKAIAKKMDENTSNKEEKLKRIDNGN